MQWSKCGELEQNIYLQAKTILSNQTNRDLFDENYPKKSIPHRNTGYTGFISR
jgi:hypothetical protein